MRTMLSRIVLVLVTAAFLGALASPAKDKGKGHGKGRGERRGPAASKSLDIPPGHLPPPGACRIWTPGVPPGHQAPPGPCARLERRLRPGDWLVYRPHRDPDVVYVDVYDLHRPRALLEVRVFAAGDGAFLRIEAGDRRPWRRN